MKTKDFIKMLQDADPSGELHVRIRDGGSPEYAVVLPGFYDGPYEYLQDGKLVISDKASKVDIYTISYEDWIWDKNGDISAIELDMEDNGKERWQQRIDDMSHDVKAQINLFEK